MVLRRVPAGDNNDAAHRTAPLLPPPLPASSISSRCSGLVPSPPPSSLAHSFIPPFIHSFIRRAQEGAGFSQPAPPPFVLVPSGEQPSTATEKCLPPPQPTPPLAGETRNPGCPPTATTPFSSLNRRRRRVSVHVVLLVRGSRSLARSMPTQQVIINKRLTNERARAQRSDGPMK